MRISEIGATFATNPDARRDDAHIARDDTSKVENSFSKRTIMPTGELEISME